MTTKTETVTLVVDASSLLGRLSGNERIIVDVFAERDRQDAQWGGPEHDDGHGASDWLEYIGKQLDRAQNETVSDDRTTCVDPQHYRDRLVKIAALAFAAIAAHDRVNTPSDLDDGPKADGGGAEKAAQAKGEAATIASLKLQIADLQKTHEQACDREVAAAATSEFRKSELIRVRKRAAELEQERDRLLAAQHAPTGAQPHDPRSNGATEPCDAKDGDAPCSCGAWHQPQLGAERNGRGDGLSDSTRPRGFVKVRDATHGMTIVNVLVPGDIVAERFNVESGHAIGDAIRQASKEEKAKLPYRFAVPFDLRAEIRRLDAMAAAIGGTAELGEAYDKEALAVVGRLRAEFTACNVDHLLLANKVTKALFPDLYGKPGLTVDQVALLMGSRQIIMEVLARELPNAV